MKLRSGAVTGDDKLEQLARMETSSKSFVRYMMDIYPTLFYAIFSCPECTAARACGRH